MEIPNNYLDKFRVFIPETLFPLQWEALLEKRCPVCLCKLYLPRDNKKMVYCKSKKHKKFFISYASFSEITEKMAKNKAEKILSTGK